MDTTLRSRILLVNLPWPGDPYGIAVGPDRALWFSEDRANRIGRMTTDGEFSSFPLPTGAAGPMTIAPGPDGACWFSLRQGGAIGSIAPEGSISIHPLPRPDAAPFGIAAGPDGAVW